MPYNLVSRSVLKQLGWRYKTDADNQRLFYHNKSYKPITFTEDNDGMFKIRAMDVWNAYTAAGDDIEVKAKQVVNAIMTHVTSEQQRRADEAITLHYLLSHPSDKALEAFLKSSSSINVPITANDLQRARALYGQCKECSCGKPFAHKGSHPSHDKTEASTVGTTLHVDIIEIHNDLCLFAVDDSTNFMLLNYMTNKKVEECCKSFSNIIRYIQSYGHRVATILTDSEVTIMACRNYLEDMHSVKLRHYIPYEHEKVVERQVRILRERMQCKALELPYKLPSELYLSLAVHAIDLINMLPNVKTGLLSPREMFCSEKTNYLTDLTASFGAPVLVTGGNKAKSHNKIGIMLGRAETAKGGICVFIPGEKRVKVRRNLQGQPMTMEIINNMNELANGTDPALMLAMNRSSGEGIFRTESDYDLNMIEKPMNDNIVEYRDAIIDMDTSTVENEHKDSVAPVHEGVEVDDNVRSYPVQVNESVHIPSAITTTATADEVSTTVAIAPLSIATNTVPSVEIAPLLIATKSAPSVQESIAQPRRSSRNNKGVNHHWIYTR